jgi:hypothetical protein
VSWTTATGPGPPDVSEVGGLGSTTKLDWDVSIEKGVTLQAAAHSSLVQDWPSSRRSRGPSHACSGAGSWEPPPPTGGDFGRFFVQGPAGPVAPSEWNRSQIEQVLAGVRLEGSLPPRRIRVQRLGNLLRGVVVDTAGNPVAGAAEPAEVLAALRGLGERETERLIGPGLVLPHLGPNHFDESDRHGEPVLRARAL